MSSFVLNPNLPKNCACVLIGEKYYEIFRKPLNKLGIDVISVPDNPDIAAEISSHADMSVLHGTGEKIYLAPYLERSELSEKLIQAGFEVSISAMSQKAEYPHDVSLNICITGKRVICSKWSDSRITNNLADKQYKLLLTKQGYSRCSVCPITENAAITADRSIASLLKSEGLDVLLISPGYIDLPGYNYGFIGGSAFKVADKVLAFTGHFDKHPDKMAILEFLGLHNIEPLFLTDMPIFDIGGAIPILEK